MLSVVTRAAIAMRQCDVTDTVNPVRPGGVEPPNLQIKSPLLYR